jgi:energy-coupling factor transporter ATP-binding protein EcfA2
VIEIEQLRRSFVARGERVGALKGIDLTIPDEKFFKLLGPSGCGKTTTLRSVAGLERPDGGGDHDRRPDGVLGGEVVRRRPGTPPPRDGLPELRDLAGHVVCAERGVPAAVAAAR